jgi:tetratricopeptide (TPR) repeat protein
MSNGDPNYHTIRAQHFLSAKSFEDALREADNAIGIDPKNQIAYHYRAGALDGLERFDDAVTALTRAIEIEPTDSIAYMNRGTILGRQAKYEEALADFDKAGELAPGSANNCYNRGLTLYFMGRLRESLEAFDRALEIEPANVQASMQRAIVLNKLDRRKEALKEINRTLAINPSYLPALLNKAYFLLLEQRWSDVIKVYDEYLKVEPKDAKALLGQGYAYMQLKNWSGAASALEQSVLLNGENFESRSAYGAALHMLDRFEDALAQCKMALSINDKDIPTLVNIAYTLDFLGRQAEGLGYILKARAIDGKNPLVLTAEGALTMALAEQTFDPDTYTEAIQILTKAIEEFGSPHSGTYRGLDHLATAHLKRAQGYAKTADLQKAKQDLQNAISASPLGSTIPLYCESGLRRINARVRWNQPLPTYALIGLTVIAVLTAVGATWLLISAKIDGAAYATLVLASLFLILIALLFPALRSLKVGSLELVITKDSTLLSPLSFTHQILPSLSWQQSQYEAPQSERNA